MSMLRAAIVLILTGAASVAYADQMTCESQQEATTRCPLNGPASVTLAEQISQALDAHPDKAAQLVGQLAIHYADVPLLVLSKNHGAILEALLKYLDALYFAEVVPALSKHTRACYTAEQQPRCQASNQCSHVHPRCVRRQAIARKTQTLSPLPSAALWHP